MKKHIFILLILACTVGFTSCEEVINVDLNTAAPRLVIDASLQWEKGTDGATQKIKLSTTTGYFDQVIPLVSGASVIVTNESGVVFDFTETTPNSGEYICTNFIPVRKGIYNLTIIHEGIAYTATEILIPVSPIDKIEQRNDGGFTGEDIEIKFFYTDNGLTNDFYLFRAKLSTYQIPEYGVSRDEFYQGNQIFDIYSNEDIQSGDQLDITLNGISEGYFNYMQVLLSIAGSAGGSPFQSPPATVRGNIINTVDDKNYVLGFFSISETDHITYTVE
jgi:hypothetical protein